MQTMACYHFQDIGIAPRAVEGSQKRCFSSTPLLSASLKAPKAVGQARTVVRSPESGREREEGMKVKRQSMQRCCHDPPLERSKKSLQARAKIEKISWAAVVEASSQQQENAQARPGFCAVNLPH